MAAFKTFPLEEQSCGWYNLLKLLKILKQYSQLLEKGRKILIGPVLTVLKGLGLCPISWWGLETL